MKRMNKEELIALINSIKIDRSEFYVLSSGALVLRNLFPDAGDLDLAVTFKGLNQLKENYHIYQKENDMYYVTDNVECRLIGDFNKLELKPEIVDGYLVENIYKYYNYLKNSQREKDKLRIPIVEKYLAKKA